MRNQKKKIIITILLICAIIGTILMGSKFLVTHNNFPQENWVFKSPVELGMSSSKLDELELMLGGSGFIVKDGFVIKIWGDQDIEVNWASSSKPVISTLLFFAVEEGKLGSVDSLVGDWNWELIEKDENMTFRHLANMMSSYARFETPGTVFAYNDRAIQLYFLTMERVFGQSINDAAMQRLYSHLQMEGSQIFNKMGRVKLTLRDFARINWLWLNKGYWDGAQIIPSWYFNEYTKPGVPLEMPYAPDDGYVDDYLNIGTYGAYKTSRPSTPGPGIYGFNWWFNEPARDVDGNYYYPVWPDAPSDTYMALGYLDANSAVIPSLGIVMATFNGDWGSIIKTDPEEQSINDVLKVLVDAVN